MRQCHPRKTELAATSLQKPGNSQGGFSLEQGCGVGTQNLGLLHKILMCINNGKPTKMVNAIIRHFITAT
jgi:hypothetical protein